MLIPHLNEEDITQEVWKDVAANESRQTMEVLLSRFKPLAFQDLLGAAAGSNKNGYDLIKYLLSLRKIAISKETF